MHSRSSLTSDDQTDNESNRSTSSLSTETQEPEKEKELLKSSVHRVVVVSRQRATSPSSMEAIPMSTFSQAESGKRSQGVTAADRQSSRLSSSRTGYPRVAQTRFMQHRPLSRTGKGTGARRLGTLPPARNSETRGRSRKSSGSAPAQGASASYWLLAKQEIDALYEKFVQRSGSNLAEKERSASASSLESDNQEIHLAPRRRFLSVPCVESLDDADLPLRSLSKEEDHGELTSSLPPQAKEEFLQRARKLKVNKSRSNSNASQ